MLPDYLEGHLSAEDERRVKIHLKNCESCTREALELKELFQAFEMEKEIVPPTSIKAKFLEQLAEEKKQQSDVVSLNTKHTFREKPWTNNLLKIAASIALLIGGFLLGKQQSQKSSNKEIARLTEEKTEFKQTAMLSLMENQSASKRIQGVNYINTFESPDESIVNALTDRMLNDENTNVRAAAVGVLASFTHSESVKNAFIAALKTEKDPGIQIEIIHVLGKMQNRNAAKPMQELLQKEGTQPFVKEQIKSVLPNII